ncbi:DEAD-domain-containing protein [Wallemia mellicola]|nr:DEAD-domain-containing protein [Wallemia mellicola]
MNKSTLSVSFSCNNHLGQKSSTSLAAEVVKIAAKKAVDGLIDRHLHKDRASSKQNAKRSQRFNNKKQKSEPSPQQEEQHPVNPPAKKAKSTPTDSQNAIDNQATQNTQNNQKKHVVSSLFTFNPEIEEIKEDKGPKQPQQAPSNAPLASTSSFEGAKLHPLLIQHLRDKLDIKAPTPIQKLALPTLLQPTEKDSVLSSRDVFIQSQTGSGKTLTYLLPIIQDLLPLGELSFIDRSIGTLAIILAPTRELARQIFDVLENLLHLSLTLKGVPEEDQKRLTRWLVGGLLTGGSTRTHEKARLRKGCPILVSTPGRLLDHLQNTTSFNASKCRWLVLDEADRLMDLGFEETITGIIKGLEGRRKLTKKAIDEGSLSEVGGWDFDVRRRNILCSATIREDIQSFASQQLLNPIVLKESDIKKDVDTNAAEESTKFTPPAQLSQKYVQVPLKLRLVSLLALLRSLATSKENVQGNRIIVFFSCTDSVDLHFQLFGGVSMTDAGNRNVDDKLSVTCPVLPNTKIYRLHGSMSLQNRLSTVREFTDKKTTEPAIMFCTSVASRGLDMPLVRAVIQVDLPTEGGANEYVHRVGRTARAGKGGEAWSFVAPSEHGWVDWLTSQLDSDTKSIKLHPVSVENVLKRGYGGQGTEFESRATDVQTSLERWVIASPDNSQLARQAYLSHIRAYATHPIEERKFFHIKLLHLGHLAKAFALRETPTTASTTKADIAQSKDNQKHQSIEQKMQESVRRIGKSTKRDGEFANNDTSEFQTSLSGYDMKQPKPNKRKR